MGDNIQENLEDLKGIDDYNDRLNDKVKELDNPEFCKFLLAKLISGFENSLYLEEV